MLWSQPPPHIQWPQMGQTTSEMTAEQTQQALKLVRSAMEPETMVAAVAQKTVWNTMYTHSGMSRLR